MMLRMSKAPAVFFGVPRDALRLLSGDMAAS
jgi:hypothetical protein